ncbi:ead/Ea22-like family protein, partial [Salmonella enterica]|nr:ead/Ea22-like family protein [Salmonella enterica]MIV19687.1 ead/Ea22-like family protein [Salmonella enterica]
MSNIDKQALREEFRFMQVHYSDPADRARQVIYIAAEALLDELETKEEQRANWFQMAQKLGEDLDAAEKRNAEQREYYEGVIADGSKRIAELEKGHQEAAKQINSWRRLEKQNIAERGKDISELEVARQRIAEQSAIVATAEKLVRCKGRYHSELNYRALAALFG